LTPVVAGVDVGNATTEVVLVRHSTILGAGRAPTRGRKGSPDSLRGAAALVRRVERQADQRADEARIASVLTVPDIAPSHGRLRVLAAGVPTPGGTGCCVGPPASAVVLVPAGLRYDEAAARINAGPAPGAVLAAGDEGVLIANRLASQVPVIDQVDVTAAAGCELVAVEVRPPGQPLRLLTDPVALAAEFGLDDGDAVHAAALCRTLADCSNAVVGLLRSPDQAAADGDEPWVSLADGGRMPLRTACARIPDWPPGTVRALHGTCVDDLFAVDLAEAAEAVIARRGSVGRAVLVASLAAAGDADTAGEQLAGLLDVPVSSPLTEPAAARLGALTTPGARDGALVVDLGAGTIDVTSGEARVTAAGAGELLTAAVAELLGIPRAAADWVKREPCIRVDGGLRYEAEDGTRGFLDTPAPPSAAGMLAVRGPGGWLPFDRRRSPAGPGASLSARVRAKNAVGHAVAPRAIPPADATLHAFPGEACLGEGLLLGGIAGLGGGPDAVHRGVREQVVREQSLGLGAVAVAARFGDQRDADLPAVRGRRGLMTAPVDQADAFSGQVYRQRAAVRPDQAVLLPAAPPPAQVMPAEPAVLPGLARVLEQAVEQREVVRADRPQRQRLTHRSWRPGSARRSWRPACRPGW
jgi:diol dehydratase reactivase ATPase-like protein/cobalamin-dependent diol dehydratase reactivating factor